MKRSTVLSLVLLVFLTGCINPWQWDYLTAAGLGELRVQLFARPIDQVLAAGQLPDDQQRKLRLVLDVRAFAVDEIGLFAGDSYTRFYDTGDQPIAYNLSAASESALEPYVWHLPLAGDMPYLGYFDRQQALDEARRLGDLGFDTYVYGVDAFSTLGILNDPVYTHLLRRADPVIIDIVIHELTHNTIWHPADTTFNESLATFVGKTGAQMFIKRTYGPESDLLVQADQQYADKALYNAFMADLYARLEAFYNTPATDAEKIAGRQTVFQEARDRFQQEFYPRFFDQALYEGALELPTNNAWVLLNRRYNLDVDLFARVHEAAGSDFAISIPIFAAAAREADPQAYLHTWLGE